MTLQVETQFPTAYLPYQILRDAIADIKLTNLFEPFFQPQSIINAIKLRLR